MKMQATIETLHHDILKEILTRVARSSFGAKNFVMAISVCKVFQQFVDDGDILRAVAFDDLSISDRWESFQRTGGLINRCAQAGHLKAQFILAKIILVSTSQLLGKLPSNKYAQLASFIRTFEPDGNNPRGPGFHFNLVRLFLSQARFRELREMQRYITDYMNYLMGCGEYNPEEFLLVLDDLCTNSMDFELYMEMFAGFAAGYRESCLRTYEKFPETPKLKEAQICMQEVVADIYNFMGGEPDHNGGFSATDLLQKIDVSMESFKTMLTVLTEELSKTIPRLSEDTEVVHTWLSFLHAIPDSGTSIEHHANSQLKVLALELDDKRELLVSKFDALLCQLMTK